MGIITAGGLSTSTWGPPTAAWAALVIRIRFSAVERAAVGLGFFLRLEAAGEGFVGGGVGLGVGVGVVGAEISCLFVGVGAVIVASCSGVGRGASWWCEVLSGLGGDFVLSFTRGGVYVVAGWRVSFVFEGIGENRGEERGFLLVLEGKN